MAPGNGRLPCIVTPELLLVSHMMGDIRQLNMAATHDDGA
jgi:hypothetical protein